ncbi:MAG: FecR domain-containing protein [Pseudobdellovibrio sp.]
MKNHRLKKSNDRIWIALIAVALVIECVWLLADLNWISLPFISQKKAGQSTAEAGYVLKAKEDLRRRSGDSLVWENTHEKDTLYYHDSLLTLSEGAARLYLKDQTELQLSENTLVTLEEPDDKSTSEIRLRFSRGDLRARNPSAGAKIAGDDWLVNLERGTEISMRKDKDSYEFEVLSGKASLQTAKGLEEMTPSKILKLGDDKKIQQIEKSSSLEWSDTKPIRVYSLDGGADVALDWKGKAKNLIINRSGENENSQALTSDNHAKINLQLGNYKVRLQDESGLSQSRDVEIWKAPRIILKKPLPRDRIKVGDEVEFVWAGEPGVKSYRLKIGDHVENVTDNFKSVRFEKESDLEWKVEGLDDDGNVIPSSYENKIFFRNEPLQAPRLKAPVIKTFKKEKTKTSSGFRWWNVFLNEAFAAGPESREELVFEWEKVQGADFYILEISTEPDFRNPVETQKVQSTKFTWEKYDPEKRYFWRVASGSSNRRMGFFSEALEVKPEKTLEEEKPVLETTEPKSEEKPAEPVVEAKPEGKKEPEVKEPLPEPQPVKIPSGFGLAWAPVYKALDFKGERNSRIRLGGGTSTAALFEFKKYEWHLQAWAASQEWKPNPENEFPFQGNLSISEARVNLTKNHYGLAFRQSFVPLRLSDESISVQNVGLVGFRYENDTWGLNLMTSGAVQELSADWMFKKYLNSGDGIKFFYGGGVDAAYQWQKDGGGSEGNLIFILGADSF